MQHNFPEIRTNSTKRLNKFLKSKIVSLSSTLFLVLVLFYLVYQIKSSVAFQQTKQIQQDTLFSELNKLEYCLAPDRNDDTCLRRLSVVSKLLDKSLTETTSEALAWGAAQSYLDSLHLDNFPQLHDRVVQWAGIEKYIADSTKYLPSEKTKNRAFRDELRGTYFKYVN